jgi:DNA helicase-2/ATP-dependent DNA helicase PcrA
MDWDQELSDEQKVAASYTGGNARLLAGPGTGKTRSLTRRVLYLTAVQGVDPHDIVLLTFTRAAAAEMRRHVQAALGEGPAVPYINTLHAYALRTILHNEGAALLPLPVRIADDFEERWVILEDLKRLLDLDDVNEARKFLGDLADGWGSLAVDDEGWGQGRGPDPRFLGAWGEHRDRLGYTLRAELVYQLKKAFDHGLSLDDNPRHLLVDEYQDLNPCDLAVVKYLVAGGAELYGAGDDDQSIYGFRGGDPKAIREFERDYPGYGDLRLTECWRCDRGILDIGDFVARQDYERAPRETRPKSDAGPGKVALLCFPDQQAESEGVASLARWLRDSRGISEGEILVLLRSDDDARFSLPLVAAFDQAGVSVSVATDPLTVINENVSGGGRELVCTLRLLVSSRDSLAWRTLLMIRPNGVGPLARVALYELAKAKGWRFSEALTAVAEGREQCVQAAQVRAEYEALSSRLELWPPEDWGAVDELVQSVAEEVVRDDDVRDRVLGVLREVREESGADSLVLLLNALNVTLRAGERAEAAGRACIMTMHQAKGLEADAVFVVAAEDEYVPGRSHGPRENDERRLLYVSLTRARHYLYVTHCRERTGQQMRSGRSPGQSARTLTRFLSDVPLRSRSGMEYVRRLG